MKTLTKARLPVAWLFGEWIGFYPGHFDQVIKVSLEGSKVVARKITGDDYIPADEITWYLDLNTNTAWGQVSEREFRNPRFVPASLTATLPDRLTVTWHNSQAQGHVDYRKDE